MRAKTGVLRTAAAFFCFILSGLSLMTLTSSIHRDFAGHEQESCAIDQTKRDVNRQCHTIMLAEHDPSYDDDNVRTSAAPNVPTFTGSMNEIRALGKRMQSLPEGSADFIAPVQMRVGEARRVTVSVTVDVKPSMLEDLKKRDSEQDKLGQLHVSPEMAATLYGDGFTITPLSNDKQRIASGFPTVWTWKVEATTDGPQSLNATLFAMMDVDGHSLMQRINSYEASITVSVRDKSWSEWFKSSQGDIEAANTFLLGVSGTCTATFGLLGFLIGRKKKGAPAGVRGKPPADPTPPDQ